jgi:hypothetical protein
MLLDSLILFRSQFTFFINDLVRNTYLAYIVE